MQGYSTVDWGSPCAPSGSCWCGAGSSPFNSYSVADAILVSCVVQAALLVIPLPLASDPTVAEVTPVDKLGFCDVAGYDTGCGSGGGGRCCCDNALSLFRRSRKRSIISKPRIRTLPRAAPTPIPAFAPAESPPPE